jgi:hypothetical protein
VRGAPFTEGAFDRRRFLARGAGVALAAGSLPTLLAACGDDDESAGQETATTSAAEGRAIVGDVIDFKLTSDDWAGPFGFVLLRLDEARFDGKAAYFIQTDASDEAFAKERELVYVPKIAPMATEDMSGEIFLIDDQPAVASSIPGRDDHTPAWRVRRASWKGAARELGSVDEARAAAKAGDLAVEDTEIVLNAAIVKWAGGEMAVDGKLTDYLGDGQLIEAPDTTKMQVRFKLHECFPASRYIVTDHSLAGPAKKTNTVLSPKLQDKPMKAEATGRTNVFMNGFDGPGPMKQQPSVFDSTPATPPGVRTGITTRCSGRAACGPRLLRSQSEVLAARDAGELQEFPGVPDTSPCRSVSFRCRLTVAFDNIWGSEGDRG